MSPPFIGTPTTPAQENGLPLSKCLFAANEKNRTLGFHQFAKDHSLATLPKIKSIIEQVAQSIRKWPQFAEQAKVSEPTALKIQTALGASLSSTQ